MSSFVIKLIAMLCMLCDHFSDSFFDNITFLNFIGRIAFPIFAFQIVISYKHTHDIKKFLLRLFICAIISQIPFSIFMYNYCGEYDHLNVMFTFIIAILALIVYDYKINYTKKYQIFLLTLAKIIIIALLSFVANLIHVDYGAWGVLLILFIHIFKEKKLMLIIGIILFAIENYFFIASVPKLFIPLVFFTSIPVVFMLLFNGKKGPSIKYLFYIFYPLHLAIFDIVNLYLHM